MPDTTPQIATGSTEIVNRQGFHVRPMAVFTELAATFESDIRVRVADRGPADGRSVLGCITLAAQHGEVLTIEAEGPDAEAAVAALVALVASAFGMDLAD